MINLIDYKAKIKPFKRGLLSATYLDPKKEDTYEGFLVANWAQI